MVTPINEWTLWTSLRVDLMSKSWNKAKKLFSLVGKWWLNELLNFIHVADSLTTFKKHQIYQHLFQSWFSNLLHGRSPMPCKRFRMSYFQTLPHDPVSAFRPLASCCCLHLIYTKTVMIAYKARNEPPSTCRHSSNPAWYHILFVPPAQQNVWPQDGWPPSLKVQERPESNFLWTVPHVTEWISSGYPSQAKTKDLPLHQKQ